jgi:hypothetical protein
LPQTKIGAEADWMNIQGMLVSLQKLKAAEEEEKTSGLGARSSSEDGFHPFDKFSRQLFGFLPKEKSISYRYSTHMTNTLL